MQAVKTQLLLKVAQNEKLENPRIEYSSKTSKSDGYVSTTEFIDIKGSNKDLIVIVKTATENLKVRQFLPIPESFHAEVNFYNKAIPLFNSINKNSESLPYAPQCYFASLEEFKEIVILKNIKPEGFIMCDRMVPMDAAHVEKTLEGFARLHAFSLVSKHVKKEEFWKLAEVMGDNLKNWMRQGQMLETITKVSKINKGLLKGEEQDVKDAFDKHCENIEDYVLGYDYSNDDLAVVGHGDCWTNNFLYKYGQDGKPADIRLIDYQLSRCNSLIYDLAFFLCACTDEKTWNNLDHFLKVYHTHLSNCIRKLGGVAEKIIPYDLLLREFKNKSKYGLIMATFFIKVVLTDHDEAPEIEKALDGGFMDKFLDRIKMQDEYDRRMLFLIKYFHKNGYLKY